MVKAQGFTLLELLITLAILAFLLFSALPLTRSWIDSNRQHETVSLIQTGLSQAIALALRNPSAAPADQASAVLCFDLEQHLLHLNSATNLCGDKANATWSSSLAESAALSLDTGSTEPNPENPEFRCLAFNNRGLPISIHECGSVPKAIRISVGQEDVRFVPLN